MRYYKVMCIGYGIDTDVFSQVKLLHGQLDGKAMVLPYYKGGYFGSPDDDDGPKKPNLAFAVITADSDASTREVARIVDRSLDVWGIRQAEVLSIEECMLKDCFDMGPRFRYEFYDADARALMNLGTFYRFMTRAAQHGIREHMVGAGMSESAALKLAEGTIHAEALSSEVRRIFAGAADGAHGRLPIHYIVEGGSATDADAASNILIGCLQAAGRLDSGHVFSIDLDDRLGWDRVTVDDARLLLSEQMVRAIDGNALVVRYGMLDDDAGFNMDSHKMLVMLLDLLNSVDHRIQVIFSVPVGKAETVRRLRASFDMPLVLVPADRGTAAGALDIPTALGSMRRMAAARGMEDDGSMTGLLSRRMGMHGAVTVEDVYAEWEALRSARSAHPEYACEIDEALRDAERERASALERLDELVGLAGPKKLVRDVMKRVRMNRILREQGLPEQPFSMNMVFAGAPGTGKTEVARLYAEILKEAGVLREGRLVQVSGAKAFDVDKAFETAAGSVLFIDEAYSMLGWSDGIASLVANMEDHRTETVVILAGYAGHMEALIDSNPGFRSRIGFTMRFADYAPEELLEIFELMCRRGGLQMASGVRERVRDVIARGGRRADQGNARFIRKMYEDAVGAQQVRLADRDGSSYAERELTTLLLEDVEAAVGARASDERPARELLSELIGLSEVKQLVSSRLDFARIQKAKRDAGLSAPFLPMHMAFKGAPGTGKTEVARLVGRILREEGVLSVGKLFERGAHDLMSGAPGTSGDIVCDLFQQARGSVIFIDEAYALLYGGPAGDEAIAAIIDQMEKLRDEVVVILAGYPHEIDQLLEANPGFASRVTSQMTFPDYSVDEMVRILELMARQQGCRLGRGVRAKARGIIERASRRRGFGNARFVRNLIEQALIGQSVRLARMMDARGEEGGEGGDRGSRRRARPTKDQLRTLLPADLDHAAEATAASPSTPVGFLDA